MCSPFQIVDKLRKVKFDKMRASLFLNDFRKQSKANSWRAGDREQGGENKWRKCFTRRVRWSEEEGEKETVLNNKIKYWLINNLRYSTLREIPEFPNRRPCRNRKSIETFYIWLGSMTLNSIRLLLLIWIRPRKKIVCWHFCVVRLYKSHQTNWFP